MEEKETKDSDAIDEDILNASVRHEGGTISRVNGMFVIRHPNIDKPRTLDSLDMAKTMLKTINNSHNKSMRELLRRAIMEKSKKMPIGTISHGRKKVAEGDWREVKKTGGGVRGTMGEDASKEKVLYRSGKGTVTQSGNMFRVHHPSMHEDHHVNSLKSAKDILARIDAGSAEKDQHMGLSDEPESKKADSGSKTGLEGIKNILGITGKIKWSSITRQQASKAIGESRGMSKKLWDRLRSIESGGASDKGRTKKKLRKSVVALVILKKGYDVDSNILYSPSDFI